MTKTRAFKEVLNNQYNNKNREIKRSIKKDKRIWTENLAEVAQRAAKCNNTKDLYKITRILSKKPFITDRPMKDKQGKLLVNENEQMQHWNISVRC
jgi:hypothetical protein